MSHSNVCYFATIVFVLIVFQLQFEIIKADQESDENTSHRLTFEQDKNQSDQARITSSEEEDEESQESRQKQQLLRRSKLSSVSIESINVSSKLIFASFNHKTI